MLGWIFVSVGVGESIGFLGRVGGCVFVFSCTFVWRGFSGVVGNVAWY